MVGKNRTESRVFIMEKPEIRIAGARWSVVLLGGLLALLCQACASPTDARWTKYEYSQIVMGVRARVTVYSKDQDAVRGAIEEAFAEMNRCDASLSDYRRDSDLSRLNESAGTRNVLINDWLALVIMESEGFSRRSGGAFDITCGPIVHLWREARRAGVLPSETEIDRARMATGWQRLGLRVPHAGSVNYATLEPGMRLDAGGIGKGFAADNARRILAAKGFDRCLIALAGDIAVGEPPPGESGWRIGVWTGDEASGSASAAVPTITVARCGVSTSGDAEQFVEIAGVRYSHIVDPRTGRALTNPISATVVAPDATTSDALGTAVCVMGEADGARMIEDYAGASARIVVRSPAGDRVLSTRGFPEVR